MKKSTILHIKNLSVSINDKQVLHNINLDIGASAIHAIMGPNGSGKSSLAHSLMGHPQYKIISGSILLNVVEISTSPVHERAKHGLFLSFQHPCEIPGVSVASFLKEAYMAVTGTHIAVADFQTLLLKYCEQLSISPAFISRGLNDGFSGGEKKRLELLQLLLLKPKVAILDEIDSGLDIDSLKVVAAGIELARKENPAMSIILITHYQRILDYIIPHFVHVLCDGRIVSSGDAQVAKDVEQEGMMGLKTSIPNYVFKSPKGLNKNIVTEISRKKNEPAWMLEFRLKALEIFESKPMPSWGADLTDLDPEDIYYYIKPIEDQHTEWSDVPDKIKRTFEKLGIPQAEQKFLAGVGAQFDSEVIYKNLKKRWSEQGVIFSDMSTALRDHPDIVKKYFSTVIPAHDNKFAALNSAVWSGGSFVYVPAGVRIDMPLQAYFRIDSSQMGQFERTLIIAEPGSFVEYVEGCSAPIYKKNSLHSAVVELVALPGAHIRYTTIQNWSQNVYNLVTKRAIAYKDARVEWVDGNFGSKVTMKYPCIVLAESGAKGSIISLAVAGKDQHQDSGGKIIHLAPHTTSTIIAKSLSKAGGRSSYRGLLKVIKSAHHVKSKVQCDALLFDDISRTDTYPTIDIREDCVDIGHEASVSKISDAQLFYLQSRGLNEQSARALIVNGFIDAFVQLLPMEYAVEINRLIAMEMEDSIG